MVNIAPVHEENSCCCHNIDRFLYKQQYLKERRRFESDGTIIPHFVSGVGTIAWSQSKPAMKTPDNQLIYASL